jgi:sortase A
MAILVGLSEFRIAEPVRAPESPARKPPIPVPELDLGLAAPPHQHSGRAHAMKKSRRREHLISGATWVRNIGALLILFAAWQLWGTAIAQHHSQASLKQEFAAKVHGKLHTKGFSLMSVSAKVPEPPDGTAMAELQIPKIALNEYVVSGTDESDLAKGPGHYIGTAMPGQAGNVAIAGHRTTHGAPFNRLAELAPGDPIYLTDLSGQRLTYIVAQTPYPVPPSNTSVLNYFNDNRLTLTTCNPEYSAAQRLIVVAEYLPPGGKVSAHPVVSQDAGTPYKVVVSGEAGWDTSLIPLVAVESLLLVALGLTNRRWSKMLGRQSRWVVLVPIWAALVFLVFQSLTSFLPAAA